MSGQCWSKHSVPANPSPNQLCISGIFNCTTSSSTQMAGFIKYLTDYSTVILHNSCLDCPPIEQQYCPEEGLEHKGNTIVKGNKTG